MKKLCSPNPRKVISFFLVFLMLFYALGCRYFKIDQVAPENIASIENIGDYYRTVYVHWQYEDYNLSQIAIDTVQVSGLLSLTDSYIYDYRESTNNSYKPINSSILDDVHIYLNPDVSKPEIGPFTTTYDQIQKIEVIEKDKDRTTLSYVFGTLGISAGFLAVVTIIVALTKSSCPYVYVYSGDGFIFEGETFGGAIGKNLIRDDYLPLPDLKMKDGKYTIQIRNELKERQYTDLARLMVINHDKENKVLLDANGKAHLISNPELPVSAKSFSGLNLSTTLHSEDNNVYLFNDEDYTRNGVILRFNKPENVENANIIINGKNTLWFDYLFGEFLQKFGSRFDSYMQEQSEVASEERVQKMVDSEFPLFVSVKSGNDWQQVDYFYTIGPLASRDMVMPVTIPEVNSDYLEIKIETGFMFWELDYAAVDYTDAEDLQVTEINPTIAMSNNADNLTYELRNDDDNFMMQESVGDITTITYNAVDIDTSKVQSVFLHTKGYYELIREFEGAPKIAQLLKFSEPGYFAEFSRERYFQVIGKDEMLAETANN